MRLIQGGKMNKQVKSLLSAIAVVLWFIASQNIIALLFLGIMGETFIQDHRFLMTLLSYILALGGLIGLEKGNGKDWLEGYRDFEYKTFYKYIGYGIGLWLLTIVINAIFIPFFPEYGAEMDTLFVNKEHIIRFLVLVIGAPVVEEYLFRGKIQGILKKTFGPRIAIIAQGVLFGVIHPFGLQKIYASILGIGFGWIREKEGHLMSSTIMHMTINCIGWTIGLLS